MKHSLSILCVLALATGLFVQADLPAEDSAERVLQPAAASLNCKPEAPIQLELFPSNLVGGRAKVDYSVTPVMDALAIEISIGFPQGGNILWHTEPSRSAAERGLERKGALSVSLPFDQPGVELIVRAHISIPDPEAPDGIGVYTTTRTATWGEVDRVVNEVTEVLVDGELTLDTAATRF